MYGDGLAAHQTYDAPWIECSSRANSFAKRFRSQFGTAEPSV
jgi:hypothetical protein